MKKMRPKVYKFYNDKNEIIYIGMSASLQTRLGVHKNNQYLWFDEVIKIIIENFETIEETREYEKLLIEQIKPKYNFSSKFKSITRDFIGIFELSQMFNIPVGRIRSAIIRKKFPISYYQIKPFKWHQNEIDKALKNPEIVEYLESLKDV